jgi:hypothetical protein
MVIDAKFDRDDHASIPATAIERGLKPLSKLILSQIKLIVKKIPNIMHLITQLVLLFFEYYAY